MLPFKRLVPALVSTILLGGLAVSCEPSEKQDARGRDTGPRPVKTVVVKAKPAEIRRVYPAVILPGREVELSFRVSGQIVELPIRGALRVEKGDVVAQLDTRDFETELARLKSQLAQAKVVVQFDLSTANPLDGLRVKFISFVTGLNQFTAWPAGDAKAPMP